MKSKIYIGLAALVAGLLSTACADRIEPAFLNEGNKEEPVVEKTMVFTATLEQNDIEAETKTSLGAGNNVLWKAGDQIRVFSATTGNSGVFILDPADDGETSGSFTGSDIGEGPYYAIYPASVATETSFNTSTHEFSAIAPVGQDYAVNSFGNGANIAVAKANAQNNFAFKNVFGVISLQLNAGSYTISQINLYTRGSEPLNGSLQISGMDSEPLVPACTVTGTAESNKKLELSCGFEGVNISSGVTTFMFAVPVGALADGFFVEVIDNTGKAMIKSAKASAKNTIVRSKLTPMNPFTYGPQFKAAFLQCEDAFAACSNVLVSGVYAKPHNYTDGKCQFARTNVSGTPGSRSIRFQDWNEGYAITLDIAKYALPLNETADVAVTALGNTGSIVTKAAQSKKVVKRTGDRAWIADLTDGDGYIVTLTD